MEFLVNTPCGPVRGVEGRVSGTVAFKGIRYATAGRWEYPVEVTAWEGVYEANAYGACSYQPRSFYNEEENQKKYFYYNEFRKGETYEYSEDCLFLNVFAPQDAKEGDGLPVLVYIHGGGFTGGCGHEKHFDGPVWPAKGVIGVTLNYRLGPMGFLCLPQLQEEAGCTGNYGLYDQLAAISWVRNNIAAFGGDPDRITIMGQSAGAMSVQQHCLSPLSQGMFRGAVMSSGGGVNKILSAQPAQKNFAFWQGVMALAGCEDLAAFRALAPEKLFEAWQKGKKELKGGVQAVAPVLDGRLVVGSGAELLAANKQHQIAYMAGSTSEDMMPPILLNMARGWNAAQEKLSYTWYFSRQLPGDDCGAWHSADLWYWFGTLDNCWRPMEEQDRILSDKMTEYLCNFVKTGNPNGQGLNQWVASDKGQKQVMGLDGEKPAMTKPSMLKMIKTMLTNKAVGE